MTAEALALADLAWVVLVLSMGVILLVFALLVQQEKRRRDLDTPLATQKREAWGPRRIK